MKKSIVKYMEPRKLRKNAQAMIDEALHEETSKNLKKAGLNWVKLIESACKQFNEEFYASWHKKEKAG